MFVLSGTDWRFTSKHIYFSISPTAAVHSTDSSLTYSALSFFICCARKRENRRRREGDGGKGWRRVWFHSDTWCSSCFFLTFLPVCSAHQWSLMPLLYQPHMTLVSGPLILCDDCTWNLTQVSSHHNLDPSYP